MTIELHHALTSLRPGAGFVVYGTEIKSLDADVTVPTDAEIEAEILKLQAEYDSKQYARDRQAEYAKLNQFEMQFDDQRDSTSTWVDAVNAIKVQFPKPE